MKEKIFIEDGLNLYKKSGTGQYTIILNDALKELGYENIYLPRKYFMEKIKNAVIKRILYTLWLNFIFPFIVLFKKSDIVFFPNTLTPFFKIRGVKYYPILHDLWTYKTHTTTIWQNMYHRMMIFAIKYTAYKIITVSETAKKEIVEYYNCDKDHVKVVNSYFSFGEKPVIDLTEEEQKNILDKFNIKSKNYILSVGNLNKRKNLQALVNAFNLIEKDYDFKLVLPGAKHSQKFKNLNDKIVFPGYISDGELKVLYKHSLIYVFPSVYEGFGLPVIDSQSFGIPLICSNLEVFHEVAGNAALFCEPEAKDIADKIVLLVNDKNMQNALIEKGYQNIIRFNKENLKGMVKRALECN